MGAACSLLLFLVICVYAGYKISILEAKTSVDILSVVEEDYFDENYVFAADQGLNIAVTVLNPTDPTSFGPIDPAYGRIRFRRREWAPHPIEGWLQTLNELQSHPCRDDELSL